MDVDLGATAPFAVLSRRRADGDIDEAAQRSLASHEGAGQPPVVGQGHGDVETDRTVTGDTGFDRRVGLVLQAVGDAWDRVCCGQAQGDGAGHGQSL